jgi:putative peptidoglycan lipid II flippase
MNYADCSGRAIMAPVMSTATTNAQPRQLFRAATVVMLFFIVSRVLGLVRDIVISHQFGTSRALDAYLAAFNVPDLIFNVIAGGALGSAFIPTFSAALAANDSRRAWKLGATVIQLALIFLTTISIVLAILAEPVVQATVARGFLASEQRLVADLMRWMLVTPIIFGISGIVMGILNSYQHFVLPALAPVLYNTAIIAGALLLAPSMGVYGLAISVVIGALLHLAIQLPWLIQRLRSSDHGSEIFDKQSIINNIKSDDVREVIRLMLPRTFGIAAVQINFLVNTVLASGLPPGGIAALSYAWRLMLLPVGVVGQSLGTAVFPTFSIQTARQEHGDFRDTFSMALRMTLYVTIPAAVGLFVLGKPLVALLFQRGEFNAESTTQTAWALQFFAIALFAHSGLEIIARAFYALHDTLTPVALGIGSMVLNVMLSVLLIAPLAQGGLALANSVATILEVLCLLAILRRRLGDIDAQRIGLSTIRIVTAAVIMGAVLSAFSVAFAQAGSVLVAIAGVIIGAIVYVGVTALLHSEEIALVWRRLDRRSTVSDIRP